MKTRESLSYAPPSNSATRALFGCPLPGGTLSPPENGQSCVCSPPNILWRPIRITIPPVFLFSFNSATVTSWRFFFFLLCHHQGVCWSLFIFLVFFAVPTFTEASHFLFRGLVLQPPWKTPFFPPLNDSFPLLVWR